MCISLLAACSFGKDETKDKTQTETTETVQPSSDEADSAPSVLGKIEIVEKDDGTKIAKSELGVEVEYSTEAFNETFAEYEAIAGKDEEKEKELLLKIQLYLEAQGME